MKKIPYAQSHSILTHFELSPEAADVIDGNWAPIEVITQLQKQRLYLDLTAFFAHALPMREALWWAVQSLRLRLDDLSQLERQIIALCSDWVQQPNEPLRRKIEQMIVPLANESAAKWLGYSVFWSGFGSIAPIDNPVVMPADFLHAKAVAGAVNTAAALPEWQGYERYYQTVVQTALSIAHGEPAKVTVKEAACQARLE
ncbi:DUF6931 family protein [Vibrio agarilyticus]|nr:hypothetical protein [Vibrio agarilyticus]